MGVEEKYKKLKILGKGATAQVYLVEEISTGKKYAMKVCENVELLGREAEIMRCVVKRWKVTGNEKVAAPKEIYLFPAFVEFFKEEKCLVMEYIEGWNLQEFLDQGNHLEIGEAVYIMDGMLRALSVLHMHNPPIVYQDLKPANIMLCRDGGVRLIDLGAACFEEDGLSKSAGETETWRSDVKERRNVVRAGTYGYAAPEQFWEGMVPDKTCDIYSAGKVFSYLLTGKNPAEPPYDVGHFCKGWGKVAVGFQEVLERSLSVAPQARYEDAESMRRAIYRAYEAVRVQARQHKRQKPTRIYEKCIWKSEYRRIF